MMCAGLSRNASRTTVKMKTLATLTKATPAKKSAAHSVQRYKDLSALRPYELYDASASRPIREITNSSSAARSRERSNGLMANRISAANTKTITARGNPGPAALNTCCQKVIFSFETARVSLDLRRLLGSVLV